MNSYTLTDARTRLGELVNHVRHTHEPTTITQHGKPSVILFPADDVEGIEAVSDYLAARRWQTNPGPTVPWDEALDSLVEAADRDGSAEEAAHYRRLRADYQGRVTVEGSSEE